MRPTSYDDLTLEELEAMRAAMLREELEALREEARAAAPTSLRAWVRWQHPHWTEVPWFHDELADELDAWAESEESEILVLTVPPGHSKSTYAEQACALAIGRDPTRRIAYVSYEQGKAEERLANILDTVKGERFREVFPEVRTPGFAPTRRDQAGAKDSAAKLEFVDHHGRKTGGAVVAAGIAAGLTSGRYDWILIDDPVKDSKSVRSPTLREDQWQWLMRVANTRKRPNRPLKIVIIMTRWHLDDLAGRVLERMGHRVRHVHFEALRDRVNHPADPRAPGEALWPIAKTREEWEEMRRVDAQGFYALAQGDPAPDGGTIVDPSWIRRYSHLPEGPGTWYQSWDPKHGSKDPASSECVGLLAFVPDAHPERCYLVELRAGIWSSPETLQAFEALQSTRPWSRAAARYVEKKGDGVTIVQVYGERFPGVIPVDPDGDKEQRLRRVSHLIKAGNLYVPGDSNAAPAWVPLFIHQLTKFPATARDDQVDALSQLLDQVYLGDQDLDSEQEQRREELALEQLERELWGGSGFGW